MSEPLPVYTTNGRRNRPDPRCTPLPPKAHKLALRMLQLAKEPGEYVYVLVVDEHGRWGLKLPAKVEELGL